MDDEFMEQELMEKLSEGICSGEIMLTQREIAQALPVLLASHRQRQTPARRAVAERYHPDDLTEASRLLFREYKAQTPEAVDLLGQLIMGMVNLTRLEAAQNRLLARRLWACIEDSVVQERAALPRRQPGPRRRRPRRPERSYVEHICRDCGYPLDYDPDDCVPPLDDDEGWEAVARDHGERCPWVDTRAHRRPR